MILSYKNKKTEQFAKGKRVKAFQSFGVQAINKLRLLDSAPSLERLYMASGQRVKGLSGDRKNQYSMRINTQWRICFEWPEGDRGPSNVEIVDYH